MGGTVTPLGDSHGPPSRRRTRARGAEPGRKGPFHRADVGATPQYGLDAGLDAGLLAGAEEPWRIESNS